MTGSLTPFAAAELAFDRALASDEVLGAQRLEGVLGGNGEYTADVAFGIWQREMTDLGFAEYAIDGQISDTTLVADEQQEKESET